MHRDCCLAIQEEIKWKATRPVRVQISHIRRVPQKLNYWECIKRGGAGLPKLTQKFLQQSGGILR